MPEYSTFRKTAWDPVIILSQIATVQCFGYSTFGCAMVAASLFSSVQLSPRLLFDGDAVRGDTVEGWTVGAGVVAMGVANILPLVYMVERSRLCIDFSLTFAAIHVILVWWHTGRPPTTLLWWVCVGAAALAMGAGGRAVCMRREMLPIAIRSFMPSRPPERQPLGGMEEHELESVAPNRPAPEAEVLFDTSRSDADAGGDSGDEGGDGDDAWEMDGWDDASPSAGNNGSSAPREAPPAPTPPSRAGTPLAPRSKGAKGD
ncbi:hypothetical protein IWW48_005635 [Coemansia sp. RSA 1200]|nr:hypothetical protein IWW48_005635 [Coemansia sp. RSA 1200]